jgi:hypothetical protein
MDTSRLTPLDMIAGVGGIVLLISLFLPWYGVSVDVAGFSASESASGWEVLSLIDIILFLCAVVAIAVVAGQALGSLPTDLPAGLVLFAAGALALLLCVFRIIDIPAPGDVPDEVDLSRKIGVFIALLSSAAIGYAGWRANAERPGGPGRATPDPATPPPPAL